MDTESRQKLLSTYIKPGIMLRFIGLALLIRIIILGFFVYNSWQLFPDRMVSGYVFKMNDYDYFLGTVDNYMKSGTMTYYDQVKPFAGRMPGYGFPYLLIRLVTGQSAGLAILIGMQVLLSAISTYILGLIALIIFGNERIFKIVFWCFAISAPTIIFDIFTLSESFSISAILFFHYFLLRFCLANKNQHLFLSGFFLAWAIFLRPFLGTFILVAPLFLLIWISKKETFIKAIPKITLFLLPFIVFESAWIARNFNVLHRFIPLETSLTESYGEEGAYRTSAIGIRSMINAWGGETGEFYDGSEGWWFHEAAGDQIQAYEFKPYVFNSAFTKDSLIQLKFIFNQSVNHDLSPQTRDSLNMLANRIALRYAADYKSKNAFRFYFINPFKMYGKLVFSNGTRLLMMPSVDKMNLIQKAIKMFYLLFYFGFIFSGIAGMILFLIKEKNYSGSSLLVLFYPWIIATTLVFYASFVIIEYRYLISAFPMFLMFGVYALMNIPVLKKKMIT
jgi:hypothetical protein